MDWQGAGATGGAVERQSSFNLGAISVDNWIRIQSQNAKPISVIMGNPPYNANQQNENDNNKNREYPEIDRRIKEHLRQGQHGPEDKTVRYVQALHTLGQRSARR